MILNNYKIVKINSNNFRIMRYERKTYKAYGEEKVSAKWRYILGYYASVELCLKALKEFVIGEMIDLPYVELIDKIEALNNAIVKCELQIEK